MFESTKSKTWALSLTKLTKELPILLCTHQCANHSFAALLAFAQSVRIADVLNPKPYPFQNVMRGPSRGFLVSCAVVAGISFASVALIVLVIL